MSNDGFRQLARSIFDALWDKWPNKKQAESSFRAFCYTIEQKFATDEELAKAIDNWMEEASTIQKSTTVFGDWLRTGAYKPFITLDRVSQSRLLKEAEELINHWNKHKRLWWQTVVDYETRIPLVANALRREFFREHWKEAFSKLWFLFKKRRKDNEWMEKITPSITWFIYEGSDTVSNTIARILEGEFGNHQVRERTQETENRIENQNTEYLADLLKLTQLYILTGGQYGTMTTDESKPWYALTRDNGTVELKYLGKTIEVYDDKTRLSNPSNDLIDDDKFAVFKTVQKVADDFNKKNYKPKKMPNPFQDVTHQCVKEEESTLKLDDLV